MGFFKIGLFDYETWVILSDLNYYRFKTTGIKLADISNSHTCYFFWLILCHLRQLV